ncbi:MAG: molybdopterin oxidoreductase family protein [Candidatus Saccharicenans sp.]|uniref:molybdopterin oxidoreductase family protein n=1 Tax=Candidatus Saccharicenans sp. TaxID=2819258 RepID=UPI00404B7A5F
MSYQRGICNFCGTGCGHLLRVAEGRVRGVYPLPGHPLSQGRLCVRGWHIHELLQTEERITGAAIRENGVLRQVSLEQALDYVANKLRGFSGEEIAFLASPRASNEDNYLFGKFARAVMKSNNLSLASDAGQEESARVLLEGCGWPAATGSLAGLKKADFILVAGGDLTKQNPILASEIHRARRAGSFVVTVSPRKTQMARLSQLHLRPNPGTISLGLEGLARIIYDEKRYDSAYLGKYTENLPAYLERLEKINLKEILALTGMTREDLTGLASRLSQSKSAYAFYPTGVQSLHRRTMAALFNLMLLTGKLGRREGGIIPVTGISNLLGSYDMGISPVFLPGYKDLSDERNIQKFEVLWQTNLSRTPGRSVSASLTENKSLRALVVVDHDEEIIRNINRIKELDLVIYFGAYQNAFTRLAQVIIPRPSYAEADGTYTNFERRVQLNRQKVEPPADVKPLWQTLTALARALGHNWKYESAEEIMSEISRVVPQYSGLSYDRLDSHPGLQWPGDANQPEGTDSLLLERMKNKFRFVLEEKEGTQTVIGSEQRADLPFKLTVGRSNYFWHQNPVMKRTFIPKREYNALLLLYPKGFVEIAEEDARRLQLREKQPVRIISESAEITLAARISPDVLPGQLYIPYFIEEMIPEFLLRQVAELEKNEEFFLPVRLEKVG